MLRLVSRWLPVIIVLTLVGATPGSCAETGRRQLSAVVPAFVSHLQPLGRLPATNQMRVAVSLPLRNKAALDDLVRQIYDRRSPNYHHYLNPAEFTARFGPTEQDYQAVTTFAEAGGLTVTRRHSNRLVLDVRGSAASVEQAFQITLHTYRHPSEQRNFFAPDSAPSVPARLPAAGLWGLSDYARPQPQVHLGKPLPMNTNGSGPGGAYQGADFRHAYAPGTSLAGSGQTAAVAEFDGYYRSDITNYEARIGYPNVPLQNILVDDVSGLPGYSGDGATGGGVAEVSLDIETTISMAPALSQLLVYEGYYGYDVFNQIAEDNLAKEISCSWVWNYGAQDDWLTNSGTTLDSQFEEMAAQGQSFFECSADQDAYTGADALTETNGPIPVDSIYVTSVGGTSLAMSGPGTSWTGESVWNSGNNFGTGGGISTNYQIPWYQTNVNMADNGGSSIYRNIPDVALTAENVYVVYGDGLTGRSDGTSSAAPLWAGFCALVNQQASANGEGNVGFLNPALYAIGATAGYAACFHDITVGNNIGSQTPGQFYAVPGYDLCTGWGTPDGTNLINSLAPPPVPYFISEPSTRGVPRGGQLTLAVDAVGQGPLVYQWLYAGSPLAFPNVAGNAGTTLILTNITTAEAGAYRVVVTNSHGAITSSIANVTITNPLPVAAAYAVTRLPGANLQISWAAVATNWSDLDGDAVTLAAISLVTTNGVIVVSNGSEILYPAAAPNVNDQIAYTVTDGQGGIGAGVINVVLPAPFPAGPPFLSVVALGNGSVAITFPGVPGYTYAVQRSVDLSAWVNVSTILAGAGGVIRVTDNFTSVGGHAPAAAYYRLALEP